MKRFLVPTAFGVAALVFVGSFTACVSTPDQNRPATQIRPRSKAVENHIPVVIAKAVPSPTASAKSKASRTARKSMPSGSVVPITIGVDASFWPPGTQEILGTIKCYQVTSVTGYGPYSISQATSPIAVFPNGASSYGFSLTPGAPSVTVNVTFSSSSCQNKQLVIGARGEGDDGSTFGGAQIFVVGQ
jgi:hypothetical protein